LKLPSYTNHISTSVQASSVDVCSIGYRITDQAQVHIEPPKVARGHAMYADGKILSVTNQ